MSCSGPTGAGGGNRRWPMKRPSDLTREQLEEIVGEVQQMLYLQDGSWTLKKPWDGGDICDRLAGLMDRHGMVPEDELCGDCSCRHSEHDDYGRCESCESCMGWQE